MAGKRNFGFNIQAGRQIDHDHAETLLTGELDSAVSAWRACISCGSCTATCPAGINFRKLHYQIRLSLELPTREELAILKSCLLCGKCQLVCPRGIPTRYLAIQIMQKSPQHAAGIPSV
jgi:ferredoxin